MDSYKGKLALVTGASTGIGYAIAKELAKRGANLIISATARSEEKLHELSSEIKDSLMFSASVSVTWSSIQPSRLSEAL